MNTSPRFGPRAAALFALAAALCGAPAGCGDGDARRPLVVYSAHARDILSDFERAFEAGHPEVDVRTVYLGSNELFERLRAERTNAQCDVWWGGDATALGLAAAESLLAPYRPSYAGEEFIHDADWRWSACFVLPMVLGYQPSRIKPEDLPKTFAEIAAPKYKDRLLLREPAASGTMRTFIGALVAREAAAGRGEDAGFVLLKAIVANARPYEGKPELLFESLEKGPGDFTVWNLTDLVFQRMKRGYTFLPAPLDEPVPVTYDGIALSTKGGGNADAQAFYEFVNTPENLARLAEDHARIPVRPGFNRAKLRPEIRDFRFVPLATDASLLREKTAAWMRRFEEETRPGRKQAK